MKNKKYLSTLLEKFIPQFVRDEYPNFELFIKYYLESLEQENGPWAVLASLPDFVDVDKTREDLLNEFILQYMKNFPVNDKNITDKIDLRFFIKNIKKFYENKGNLSSAKFIFNLLNKTIEIYYPKEKIFILGETKSKISNVNSVIHDNYYHAYYVYEIEVDMDANEWEELAKSTFHPAGTRFFGKRKIYMTDSSGNALSYGNNVSCGDTEFINDGLLDTTTGYLQLYKDNNGNFKDRNYNINCFFREINLTSKAYVYKYFISNNFDSIISGVDKDDTLQGRTSVYHSNTIHKLLESSDIIVETFASFQPSKSIFDVTDLKYLKINYFINNNKKFNLQKTTKIVLEVI